MEGKMETATMNSKNETEELRGRLDDLTQHLIESSNGKIVAMIFFGSRTNPGGKGRVDSDLDYMMVTDGFVADRYRIIDLVNSEVKSQLNLRGDCHSVMPKGNIKSLPKDFPRFWEGNRISAENSLIFGCPEIVREVKRAIERERSIKEGKLIKDS